MKAILQFDLDLPEDKEAHLRATKATDAYLVIWDMFQELRKDWKYSQDPEVVRHAERYRDLLRRLTEDHGIDLDNEIS
jgi:uncharacterized NAD(P)/FAD-binding protein YdhS